MKKKIPFKQLWGLVQCLLVLSHGQAGVKRGNDINNEIMAYNFKERSVFASIVIYDHIESCDGVLNVKIDQELRSAAKIASSQFQAELKRQQEEERNKKDDENKSKNDEIFALKGKRKRLLEDCSNLCVSAEKLMDSKCQY